MEGEHKEIFLDKGDKGQGGQQLFQSRGLEGVDNDGNHIYRQNSGGGGHGVIQIRPVAKKHPGQQSHTQKGSGEDQDKLEGGANVKILRNGRGGGCKELCNVLGDHV